MVGLNSTQLMLWGRPATTCPSAITVSPRGKERRSYHEATFAPPTMPVSEDLQNLYSLNTASPDFSDQLYHLIRNDEREKYLTSLRGPELARLVNFLDEVRGIPLVFHQFTKQTPQALNVVLPTDDVARICLRKLQAICSRHAILPSSYVASDEIARVGDGPIAFGSIADLWEGTYRDNKVSIKCLKASLINDKSFKKVRVLCGTFVSRLIKDTCGPRSHSSKRPLYGKD